MGNVVIDMSMSLDGSIADRARRRPGTGTGRGRDAAPQLDVRRPSVFERVYGDLTADTGAVIMGRRSYDDSIEEWGGKGPLGEAPCFVITHEPPSGVGPVFTFVTDGIESALARAREVAGDERIGLMGADVDRQFLAAALVDEIRIHLVDVLLGGGRRLLESLPQRVELEQTALSRTDGATHLEYRVVR
jgi:dihydrofolate reductase